MTRKHPAKFSDNIMDQLAHVLLVEKGQQATMWVLDPFAGVGRIHELRGIGIKTVGIEIEPEWADQSEHTMRGDAHSLPFPDGSFDAICTSPCLAHGQRVLTVDLRWVDVATVRVGDRLMGFDETSPGKKINGHPLRRKYAFSNVVRSEHKQVECFRVGLSNGDEVTTTGEHPWLVHYAVGYKYRWISTNDLVPNRTLALKQFETWESQQSYRAGWLAGMMDGEGSLSLGTHGSPKLVISQKRGSVSDEIGNAIRELGFKHNVIPRSQVENRLPVENHYFNGGIPDLVRALGELRPMRLLEKWQTLDLTTRSIQPERVTVISVEPVGVRDIQEIETSTGTYFGEGYMMHNCYGNRMSDNFKAKDSSKRHTYRAYLGREVDERSAGKMQWGTNYKAFHIIAWTEATRVLKPGGMFVLNTSNHIRNGEEQLVTEWHGEILLSLGYKPVGNYQVTTPRNRFGANRDLRVEYETIGIWRKP